MQIAWASETPGTTQIAWAPVRDSSIGNTLERSPPKAGFFFCPTVAQNNGVRLTQIIEPDPFISVPAGQKNGRRVAYLLGGRIVLNGL